MTSTISPHKKVRTPQLQSQTPREPQFSQIKRKIDSLLAKDLALLNRDPSSHTTHSQLALGKHNHLILKYVSNNYEQYCLPDPLPTRTINLAHKRHISTVQLQKLSQTGFKTNIKTKESSSSRNEEVQWHSNIVRHFKTEPDEDALFDQSAESKSKVESEIQSETKSTKKVIILKRSRHRQGGENETKDKKLRNFDVTGQSFEKDFSFSFQGIQLHQSRIFGWNIKDKIDSCGRVQPVKESYRYCIGCEDAVLEANIPFHEQKCSEFQSMAALELEQMASILQAKVRYYRSQLIKLLQLRELQQIEDQQSIGCLTYGLDEEVSTDRLCDSIQRLIEPSVPALETLSRVRWFMKVHRRMGELLKKQTQIKKIV